MDARCYYKTSAAGLAEPLARMLSKLWGLLWALGEDYCCRPGRPCGEDAQ